MAFRLASILFRNSLIGNWLELVTSCQKCHLQTSTAILLHSARFWACFAALSAVAHVLHALYVALRSLRALEASLLLSLAALASSSASKAEIIASPVRICPELVPKAAEHSSFDPLTSPLLPKPVTTSCNGDPGEHCVQGLFGKTDED